MKKLLFLAATAFVLNSCIAQDKQPPASPHDTVSAANVKVTYGRPYKKGRAIFGGLVPYDQVWRTGANEATEITFAKDGTFGGQPVKAGTYSLFTIPTEKEWTIILNSALKQWGSFGYDKIKDKDVLKVKVPAGKAPSETEQFTITLPANSLVLTWDKTQVTVPYKL